MFVYFNNQFVKKKEVSISPDDRGFLFGDGVYEVVSCYKGRLFELEKHISRMEQSLYKTGIKKPDRLDFKYIAEGLIQKNDFSNKDALVYIQITRGVAPRKHAFPDADVRPTVYAFISPFDVPYKKCKNGVKIILVKDIRWTRCDIKSISLLPNVMFNQQAKDNGAEESVFVRDGYITEGSHTTVFAVYNGDLVTHPLNNYILPGITREVVFKLCNELKINIQESPVSEKELNKADEIMLVGTSVEIMPVIKVDDWTVGTAKPGHITKKLQNSFGKLIR